MAPAGSASFTISTRLLAGCAGLLLSLELAYQWQALPGSDPHALPAPLQSLLAGALAHFIPARSWAAAHPRSTLALALLAAAAALAAYRLWLTLWRNHVIARLSGTYFKADDGRFPARPVELFEEITRRPKGHTFVGLTPRRTLLGWRWRPVYLDERQRTTHRHVLGKTGSGKTTSVLWPQVLQDVLDGKGCVVLSGKGSDEEIGTVKAIAAIAKRHRDLRVFALPAWNQPAIPSHTYNMVWVDPRTPDGAGGDPAVVAERVFSVLPLGTHHYYNTQAQLMFTNLCRLLHGMVDPDGHGLPFTMRDVALCLKAIGLDANEGALDGVE